MADRTHYAFTVGSVRFVAMNAFEVAEPGSFVVSEEQLAWVKRELQTATDLGQRKVLLLHCYPSDLKVGGGELMEVLRNFEVQLIDTGHTHYNEIANDGRTLYTATRSTGQIEEGPVDYSVTNLDGGVVSWRFVELNKLPMVMITSPSDERLLTESRETLGHEIKVRAKGWSSAEVVRMTARFEGRGMRMQLVAESQVWETSIDVSALVKGVYALHVEVEDASEKIATDEIRLVIGDRSEQERVERDQDNVLESWPEHGLLGTQLGPNKKGKKW